MPGINKYLFEMANIRNQCSWVHGGDAKAGTEKAKDLVRMAVAKVALFEPMSEPRIKINQTALVIGGGLAGMSAARNLAVQGYHTCLIEKEGVLGGQAQNLYQTWKGENVQQNLAKLIQDVQSNPKIDVYLNTELKQVEGFVGNFKSTLQTNGNEKVSRTWYCHCCNRCFGAQARSISLRKGPPCSDPPGVRPEIYRSRRLSGKDTFSCFYSLCGVANQGEAILLRGVLYSFCRECSQTERDQPRYGCLHCLQGYADLWTV